MQDDLRDVGRCHLAWGHFRVSAAVIDFRHFGQRSVSVLLTAPTNESLRRHDLFYSFSLEVCRKVSIAILQDRLNSTPEARMDVVAVVHRNGHALKVFCFLEKQI